MKHTEQLQRKKLKQLKHGEFFKRIILGNPGAEVWTRREYQRDIKKYMCWAESDISKSIDLRGDTVVEVGFTY